MTIENVNKFNRPAITSGTVMDITDLEIQDEDEVKITRQNADGSEAVLVITTDYTVSTDLNTVTLVVAIDGVIFIKSTATLDMVFNQDLDLENFDDFNVENVETALDQLQLVNKQQEEEADRNVRFIVSSAITSLEVDDPTGGGDKFMKLKTDLSGFEFQTLSATAGLGNVIEDLTPQLGGDLDTNGNDIDVKNGDNVVLKGASFDTTVDKIAPTAARTVSLPDATDTLVGKATTDTLTNKTIDADGTGNVITNIGSSEIKSELITGQSDTAIAVGDSIIYSDVDDSDNLKKDTVQGLLDLAEGTIVQVVNTQTGAVATGTTTTPHDDTIPQNTEGDEYMTLAITPTNSSNKLLIEVLWNGTNDTVVFLTAGLFQDSTANGLAAVSSVNAAGGRTQNLNINHFMTAGTTSATTFKVRVGGNAAGTTTFNGAAGGRIFGGVYASSITITEIKV